MPKVVDHEARRAEIVRATWRLIAAQGIERTTMREIARELGLANGSVMHYFPHKRAILRATFEHVFQATNVRVSAVIAAGSLQGLPALEAFLLEALPLDEERLLEARIVIPFLEYAAIDQETADLFRTEMQTWSDQLRLILAQARERGEARADLDVAVTIDLILSTITGAQSVGVLLGDAARPVPSRALTDAAARMRAMVVAVLASVR